MVAIAAASAAISRALDHGWNALFLALQTSADDSQASRAILKPPRTIPKLRTRFSNLCGRLPSFARDSRASAACFPPPRPWTSVDPGPIADRQTVDRAAPTLPPSTAAQVTRPSTRTHRPAVWCLPGAWVETGHAALPGPGPNRGATHCLTSPNAAKIRFKGRGRLPRVHRGRSTRSPRPRQAPHRHADPCRGVAPRLLAATTDDRPQTPTAGKMSAAGN